MRHKNMGIGAIFSSDGTKILTWGDYNSAQLWHLDVDYDFPPEHLPLFVEVATGTAVDDYDNFRFLNSQEWEERRKKYIKIAEEHLKTCKYKHVNVYLQHQKPA